MRADTQNWIATAEYDLQTARHMLDSGRYLYVVFCCHLALEKMLKAHLTEVTQTIPTKTHDLLYLAAHSRLSLPEVHRDFVGKINNASIPTRYPDDLQRAIRDYPESIARSYLQQTEEAMRWLKQHPNLKP